MYSLQFCGVDCDSGERGLIRLRRIHVEDLFFVETTSNKGLKKKRNWNRED